MKNIYRRLLSAGTLLAAALSLACAASPTATPAPPPTPTPTVTPTPIATPLSVRPTATSVPLALQKTSPAPQSLDGRWEGAVQALGTELEIGLDIASPDAVLTATIDIPQQGVDGLPLSMVSYNPPQVRFEIDLGQFTAVFVGEVRGETISGEFQQSGVAGTFQMERVGAMVETSPTSVSVPYQEEEVNFQNGDITLAGTLTLPPGNGPYPALVLITGSGPQDRNEELFGFQLFGIMADHFTRRGIAVLRYDDRGVGGSTGNVDQATSEDFAGDVVAAVELLTTRGDINDAQIGLLGHSEGGIVAPMAAVQSDDVSFIILMAGTGVPGYLVSKAQLELIAPPQELSEAEIKERRELQERSFEAVRTGQGFDELEADLRQQVRRALEDLPEEERQSITDMDRLVNDRVQMSLAAMRTPWFKFFLDYDPAVTLGQVTVPVLALFGELDLQVPPEINRPAIERALEAAGNDDVTSVVIPRANHLFQEARSGNPSEYAILDKEFAPGFLELITGWVLDRVDLADGALPGNPGQ